MICHNTHCKYYVPAESFVSWFGTINTKGGCKYAYCKKKKVNRNEIQKEASSD